MQFKKSAVVGVVMFICLTNGFWCHYIPEKKISQQSKKNETFSHTPKADQIQICGNELTNLIIEACDGILGSLSQANASKDSVQTKITEDCCDHKCPLDYIQNYCGQTPLFATKKTLRGELLSKLSPRNRFPTMRGNQNSERKEKKKTSTEVRIKNKLHHHKKGWKKRKKLFKWKCAFKSFGHYLINLNREAKVAPNKAKKRNNINRSWPSIQIGTISPEIDKFGGQPIVMVKKNKANAIL